MLWIQSVTVMLMIAVVATVHLAEAHEAAVDVAQAANVKPMSWWATGREALNGFSALPACRRVSPRSSTRNMRLSLCIQ